jgi:hypothetical protein
MDPSTFASSPSLSASGGPPRHAVICASCRRTAVPLSDDGLIGPIAAHAGPTDLAARGAPVDVEWLTRLEPRVQQSA